MGASGVVRKAESEPVSGCCGCVVGRVEEVEFVGVCGRTRRPVLDFRRTVGVIVAACAGPATYVAPHWQVAARRVVSPRGFHGCAPMMGATVVVRNTECGPYLGFCECVVGRVVEVEFVGVRGRTRRPVLDFRPAVGPVVAAVPATYVAPRWQVAARRVISPRGFYGCASMMGAVLVVRKAE